MHFGDETAVSGTSRCRPLAHPEFTVEPLAAFERVVNGPEMSFSRLLRPPPSCPCLTSETGFRHRTLSHRAGRQEPPAVPVDVILVTCLQPPLIQGRSC